MMIINPSAATNLSITGQTTSCKKIISSARSGNSLARSLAIVNPTVENRRSTGAEVAGMHNILVDSVSQISFNFCHMIFSSCVTILF